MNHYSASYGETNTMGVVLGEEDEESNKRVTSAMALANLCGKSTCASWRYFGEGEGSQGGLLLEALLSYWLSWFIFSSGPDDGLTDCVLLLAISLTNGKRLALAVVFLGYLYAHLEECLGNVSSRWSLQCSQTCIYQLSLNVSTGAFRGLGPPNSIKYPTTVPNEAEGVSSPRVAKTCSGSSLQ